MTQKEQLFVLRGILDGVERLMGEFYNIAKYGPRLNEAFFSDLTGTLARIHEQSRFHAAQSAVMCNGGTERLVTPSHDLSGSDTVFTPCTCATPCEGCYDEVEAMGIK